MFDINASRLARRYNDGDVEFHVKRRYINTVDVQHELQEAGAAAKRIHSDPNDERSTMGESAHDTTVNPATAPRTPDTHTKAADEVKRQRDIANGYDNASRQSGVPRHSSRTSALSPR